MKICDIHTHILPGVDDGAQTTQQAVQMIANAVASNVEYLVVTPHCNRPGMTEDPCLQKRFEKLCGEASHLPVKLAMGAEVHVTQQLPARLRKGEFPTINGSRYLLTEFPFHWEKEGFVPVLESILRLGYVPVVAHPERYEALWEAPEMVDRWLELGCHIQLTAGSVVGKYGNRVHKTAGFLLKNGMACCVASDAHGTARRNNNLLEVQSYLSLYYSKQCAKALLWDNPMKILRDENF